MRKFKGTKGKWRVSKITGVIMGVGVDLGDGYSKDIFHFTDLEDKENKANAQLIAYAPELLSALRQVLGCIDAKTKYQKEVFGFAEQIIKKAIG